MIIKLFFFTFFLATAHWAWANPFPEALDAHEKRMKINIENRFLPTVEDSSLSKGLKNRIKAASINFLTAYKSKAEQLKADYETVFVKFEKNEVAKNRSTHLETGLKWATQIVLKSMAVISSHVQKNANERLIEKELKKIIKATSQVQLTDENKNHVKPEPMARVEIIPMKAKGSIRTLCSAFLKLCFQESVTDLLEGLPEEQFLRQYPENPKFWTRRTNGSDLSPGLPQIPENAAVILTMNHDHQILDLKFVRKIARALGIARTALLTTRVVWALGKQDQNTLFIQDKDLSSKVTEVLKDSSQNRSAVAIYPEGNLPLPETQLPIISKMGAYIISRKSDIQLAEERPVYLIDIQSNLLKYSTSLDPIPLEFIVSEPELVPTQPLGKRDAWSEKKRLEFETRANGLETRSLMVDLKSGNLIPGTNTRAAIEINEGSRDCRTAVGL
ncbi:MAG: hypothetical protein ACK5V3_17945 [Bdellovibrionales bacterium]